MRPALPTAALAIALALVTATVAPAAADAGRPAWSTGDFWAYAYTGSVFPTITGPGTYRLEVVGIDTVSLGGTSYESYRVRLSLNGSNVVQFHGGDNWYRTSDLSLVKTTFNVTATILFVQATFVVTVTYDPPLAIQWPLVTAGTWTTSSTRDIVAGIPLGSTLLDATFVVEAPSTVTVPAGSFETTPLRDRTGERSTTYWAPGAGNYARRQTFNANDQETSSAELTSFRYQGGGFLGLPILAWVLIIALVVAVVLAVAVGRRRRATMPPRGQPPG